MELAKPTVAWFRDAWRSVQIFCFSMSKIKAIRISVITGKLDHGGTEQHLLHVLPRLVAAGFDVEVCAMHGPGALSPRFRQCSVPVREGTTCRGRWALALASIKLGVHLLLRRPHVCHFFLPEAYIIGSACTLPMPWTRRVMSRRSLNLYQAKYNGIRAIECWLHPRMHALLGNARAVTTQLLEEGAPRERVGLIYNGTVLPSPVTEAERALARARLGVPVDAFVGLTVANLLPYKGHADLLRGLATVARRLPAGWIWLCAGRDDGIGAGLRDLAERLGISDNVRWLGAVPDTSDCLRAADIGAIASHEEGFSNAVLEGMAAGLPMVVTAVGGNAEAVIDRQCGRVIRPHSPDELGAAVLELAESETLREAWGRHGRARIAAHFSLDHCVRLYQVLYENLVSGAQVCIPEAARLSNNQRIE